MEPEFINPSKCLVLLICLFCLLHTSKGTVYFFSVFLLITFGKDSVKLANESILFLLLQTLTTPAFF